MFTFENLTLRLGGKVLLSEASARIAARSRIGLVGRNGAGKTSLLKLITGVYQPDAGEIRAQKDVRIGVVSQEAPASTKTPLEVVLEADVERASLLKELEQEGLDTDRMVEVYDRLEAIDAYAAPARAAQILKGLGFSAEGQERPLGEFSGGWRMRVSLAAVLFLEPELLLLDEPTNHLDFEATIWLENYLQRYSKSFLVISHDRHFLNGAVNKILHLEGKKLHLYSGSFDDFERERAQKIAQSAAFQAKADVRIKHMQSFVSRFGAKASKARQAQRRVKAIEKLQERMENASILQDDDRVQFIFPQPKEIASPLVRVDSGVVGYEEGKPILSDLNFSITGDDRIALLGANGNGKSTLAKLIAGRMGLQKGEDHRSNGLRVGFFAQHQIEDLDGERTALDHMADALPKESAQVWRSRLGTFGIIQNKADQLVAGLSGGEKAKLTFALMAAERPHLLILDEPTNHLDMQTCEALVESVASFEGAVILISHDRNFVELTADQLWLVKDGVVTLFEGDTSDYEKFVLKGDSTPSKKREKTSKSKKKSSKKQERTAQTVEKEMAAVREEIKKMDDRLGGDGAIWNDLKEATELSELRKQRADALDKLEEEYFTLIEE